MSSKKIHDHVGHRQRMYDKINGADLNTFPDHEILESLLYFTDLRKNTNGLAHEMKNFIGSISKLGDLDYRILQAKFGFTERTTAFWKIIIHLINMKTVESILNDEDFVGKPISDKYLLYLFKEETTEAFYVICLNNEKKMKQVVRIVDGTPENVNILLRKINKEISLFSPKYIILAHNHPSGTLRPSVEDVNSTKILRESFRPFGITVYDHFIVGKNKCYSFKKHNIVFQED